MHSFSYTVKPERDVKQTHLIGSISVEVDFLQRTQLVANHPNFLPQLITFFPSSFSSSPSFHPLLLPLPFSTLQKSSACNQHRWYGYIFSGEVLRQCLLLRPSGKHFEPAVKYRRIIVYWVLLKCTVFRLFSGQRRRFHCWKEQCFRSLVSLLRFSHYLPSPSPSKGYYLIFYPAMFLSGGCIRGDDWRRLKDFKEGTFSARPFTIFGIFWSALLPTRMQNIARNGKKWFTICLSLYMWTCFLSFFPPISGNTLLLCKNC